MSKQQELPGTPLDRRIIISVHRGVVTDVFVFESDTEYVAEIIDHDMPGDEDEVVVENRFEGLMQVY